LILFYDKKRAYYEFSNFFYDKKNPIFFNGKSYPTAEHAYQAAKFIKDDKDNVASSDYAEIIRNADTPNQARILGNQKCKGGFPETTKLNPIIKEYQHIKMKENWNEIHRDEDMQRIIDAKFSQSLRLKQLLIATGDKRIKEDSRDSHWGGDGDNALGLILERTREKLIKHEL
jgi:ribA/ribD-fused uncharacterized protein